MGTYLNPSNIELFNDINHSKIYIDKTEIISFINDILLGQQRYICISRPRRFGKSMTVNMLKAYYSKGCDSAPLFDKLKISGDPEYKKHLNKYNVISLNMTDYIDDTNSIEEILGFIEEDVSEELMNEYGDLNYPKRINFIKRLNTVFTETNIPFVFIIDEWDCIFREYPDDTEGQAKYLDFLRNLLKDRSYIALAYMTGILPIKKYGIHSALNMFYEYTMTNAEPVERFFGFTEEEVTGICDRFGMDIDETKRWYDGYCLNGLSIFNPRSVVEAMTRKRFDSYWTKTETYESLKKYIQMDIFGLKEMVTKLIAGEHIPVNPDKFQNDMTTFNSADDVLTLLIHLGYLTFDFDTKTVWIPNSEVQQEFINSIEDGGWEHIMSSINKSDKLLKYALEGDSEMIAEMIRESHRENASVLKYNDENSLSCVISFAYYTAKKKYVMYREMQGGEGYADMVFVPRKNCTSPAFIVELKYDLSAETAIDQIKQKKYFECLKDYSGEILLVGVNYDKKTKEHSCVIESVTK